MRAIHGNPRRRAIPRPAQPDPIRVEYFKAITSRYLAPARALVDAEVLPEVRLALADRTDARLDGNGGRRVNKVIEQVTRKFWSQTFHTREVEALAERVGTQTDRFQKQQFAQQTRAGLGVDVLSTDPPAVGQRMDDFVGENVALIRSVPTQYFSDIEKVITREVNAGTRHEDITRVLTERYGVAENRAKLIARDQVGKFYGQLSKVRQEALGVVGFVWRTVHDNRVREDHAALDGQSFDWNDPPSEGIPGEPINCRCWAEPDFSDILGED